MKPVTSVTWIGWIIMTATAALTMAAFVFANFETKDSAREKKEDIVQRLDRIELKLDKLIENQ